jgi:leucyl-tRNA synthetase
MPDEAKVRSVESLEYFRSALINFLTKSRQALGHAEDGVKRGRYWVEQEQHNHWIQEGKKRTRKLAQAQAELLTAKLSKWQDSVMLQEKIVRRCKLEVEEAEEKYKATKKWAREFDRTFDPACKGLTQLRDFLEHDLVKGVADMDQSLRTLAAYLERERPAGAAAAVPLDEPAPAAEPPPSA